MNWYSLMVSTITKINIQLDIFANLKSPLYINVKSSTSSQFKGNHNKKVGKPTTKKNTAMVCTSTTSHSLSSKTEAGLLETLNKFIPKLDDNYPLIVLILNIVFSGIGTLLAAFLTKKDKKKRYCLIFGLLQFFFGVFVFGWIWSVVWGIFIYKRVSS